MIIQLANLNPVSVFLAFVASLPLTPIFQGRSYMASSPEVIIY